MNQLEPSVGTVVAMLKQAHKQRLRWAQYLLTLDRSFSWNVDVDVVPVVCDVNLPLLLGSTLVILVRGPADNDRRGTVVTQTAAESCV
jgi:hypothetical protein